MRKQHPIIFSREMVRAILGDRKSQTRRVVKPQPPSNLHWGKVHYVRCPFGQSGDYLWVRETWRVGAWNENTGQIAVDYKADNTWVVRKKWLDCPDEEVFQRLRIESLEDAAKAGVQYDEDGKYHWEPGQSPCRWRSSLYMPKWASRILLEVTDVHCERLQDIECRPCDLLKEGSSTIGYIRSEYRPSGISPLSLAVSEFRRDWDVAYEKRGYGWDRNPWVWVINFKQTGPGEKKCHLA